MPKEGQPKYESSRRTQYCLVTVGAWTGAIIGAHLFEPDSGYAPGGSTTFNSTDLTRALPDLVEGGYVIDERILADDPKIVQYVMQCPLCSGRLTGEKEKVSEDMRITAAGMFPLLDGEYKSLAYLLAAGALDNEEGTTGFDRVSAEEIAVYWLKRGATVGRKVNGEIQWLEPLVGNSPESEVE